MGLLALLALGARGTVKSKANICLVLRQLLGAFVTLISCGIALAGTSEDFRILIALLIFICSVVFATVVRNNTCLFIMACVIGYANYSACVVNTAPILADYDTVYCSQPISAFALDLVLLFMGVLIVFLPSKVERGKAFDISSRWAGGKYEGFLVAAIIVALIVLFITGSSGFRKVGFRAENSSLFEYSYILFLFGFMIAGNDRKSRIALLAIALLYFAQAFLGGNRASVLAILLLVVVFFFSNRFSWKSVLPVLALGLFLMMAIGYFREDGLTLSRLPEALGKLFATQFKWDTATFAFHQSIAFLRLDLVASTALKLYLTKQWLLSCILGTGAVPDSRLSTYCQERMYPGMGGGFLPHYAYFYGGLIGVVVAAFIVALLIRLYSGLNSKSSDYSCVVAVAFLVTFCRWYLYSPSPLTSGMVFLTIGYMFIAPMARVKNPQKVVKG